MDALRAVERRSSAAQIRAAQAKAARSSTPSSGSRAP